jgi:hypothetical protein
MFALVLAVVVVVTGSVAGDVRAASLQLSETERTAAVRFGTASVQSDAFGEEWRVSNGNGEAVTVLTPFHVVANAARHATFKNDPLKPADLDKLLRGHDKRLVLIVTLRGPREDFAQRYAPRLLAGDREIKPTFVQNERTAGRRDDGIYVAQCTYGFPTRDLSATTRASLVIGDGAGRDVVTFVIDLASMR